MYSLQITRLGLAARFFTLLAVGSPILWYQQSAALGPLAALALVFVYQFLVETRRDGVHLHPLLEATVIGVVAGYGLHHSEAVLGALAVMPFVAALTRSLMAMESALILQGVAAVATALLWWGGLTADQGFAVVTWSIAGLGFGLIGNFVRNAIAADVDPLSPYLDAQRLIRQLIDLSGDLSSGLDVTTIGGEMLAVVGDIVPTEALGIYVPRGESLTPIARSSQAPEYDYADCEFIATEAWARGRPVLSDRAFAVPVGETAVAAGVLPPADHPSRGEGGVPFERIATALGAHVVKFDTALLFAQFRDSATAGERQRLAREMHDGVAQDIASLGYLVDALQPADEKQAKHLAMLRERVSAVVAEVRQSVTTLRTSIGESESLGAAIGAVARHLSEASGVPIRVRLDEQATRLRPEVEAELFRIAQEAMNNAIKHAHASAIDVHCMVYAPEARIIVSDDGRGLQLGRSDSHGLKIMRERARLIGARLSVEDNPGRGLRVAVTLGRPSPSISHPQHGQHGTAVPDPHTEKVTT